MQQSQKIDVQVKWSMHKRMYSDHYTLHFEGCMPDLGQKWDQQIKSMSGIDSGATSCPKTDYDDV